MAAVVSARYVPLPVRISAFYQQVVIFLILASLHGLTHAQQSDDPAMADLKDLMDERYGADQHLVNGIEYFNLHIQTDGHKFLDEDKYYMGWIVIDQRTYSDVHLKYDIFGQRVLLLIEHPGGGNRQIILNNLRIREFEINNRHFRKFTFPGEKTRFYQVIGKPELSCLHYYSKQEIPKPVDNNTLSEFTDTKRKSYLYRPSGLHEFKSNRSFLRLFPEYQSQIKAYLRKHKLKVRKLDDGHMGHLIDFCSMLTGTDSTE
jgi:hypothetical protein